MARSSYIYLVWVGFNDEPEAAFTVKHEALWYIRQRRKEEPKMPMGMRRGRDGDRADWIVVPWEEGAE